MFPDLLQKQVFTNSHILMTNQCLDHQHSLLHEVMDKLMNIDALFSFKSFHHGVECDEGACPPNTSTAVNQENVCIGIRMRLSHSLDEVDHGEGIGRDSMIWPCKVVKQCDLKWRSVGFSTL